MYTEYDYLSDEQMKLEVMCYAGNSEKVGSIESCKVLWTRNMA